jgi:cysteinyl-tRNA synthetase
MADLHLFNSLTKRKERFTPADPERVTMYLCGPTVYNYVHIGNAVGPVAFDVLYRLLRRLYGAEHVLYARNFTDVDDRIIAAAAEEGLPIAAITEKYTRAYQAQMAALGVLAPDLEPRATDHIGEMIALIERLLASGAAYRGQSGVWFSVKKDADYGRLSGRAIEEQMAGARVEIEPDKRDPEDFALWKAAKPGEPAWEAPFGRGRPGWHVECSAMIADELGETIDIHAGGSDLIFPHHENEIAQSETAWGKPLARFWLHNGMLTMNAEKMSKSLGNVVLLKDLLDEGWAGETIRYALLSAHYRTPPNWSEDLLRQAKASLDRLYGALEREKAPADPFVEPPAAVLEALCDDLNTPKAIAELFALAGALNKAEAHAEQNRLKSALVAAGALLGLLQDDPAAWFRAGKGQAQDAEIEALLAARFAARKAKDFAEADRIRAQLGAMGVIVMDGPQGSTWRRAG